MICFEKTISLKESLVSLYTLREERRQLVQDILPDDDEEIAPYVNDVHALNCVIKQVENLLDVFKTDGEKFIVRSIFCVEE